MDSQFEPNTPISEQAALWWALLHSEGATSADHREFGEWIARSPERVAAYLQLARLIQALKSDGRVRWPDTSAESLIEEARAAAPDPIQLARVTRVIPERTPRRSFSTVRLATATVVVLASIIGLTWFMMLSPSLYATRFGEQRSILLEDGSRVTLNTASRIDVQLEKNRRTVRLLAGEALFEVAHDSRRPFEVHAGSAVLRAVGTQFNVDMRTKKTTLTVLEGRVAVLAQTVPQRNAAPNSDSQGGNANGSSAQVGSLIIAAAQRLVITPTGLSAPEHVENLAATTAWTRRQLVFERERLSEVTEEFNRYSRQRIVIASPELAQQEVTGVIQSDDPASFLSFLSGVPGVEIREGADGSRIVAQRGAAATGRSQ